MFLYILLNSRHILDVIIPSEYMIKFQFLSIFHQTLIFNKVPFNHINDKIKSNLQLLYYILLKMILYLSDSNSFLTRNFYLFY